MFWVTAALHIRVWFPLQSRVENKNRHVPVGRRQIKLVLLLSGSFLLFPHPLKAFSKGQISIDMLQPSSTDMALCPCPVVQRGVKSPSLYHSLLNSCPKVNMSEQGCRTSVYILRASLTSQRLTSTFTGHIGLQRKMCEVSSSQPFQKSEI